MQKCFIFLANLPGITLQMSDSPLKALDDIEIANDYVMESGLIFCDNSQLEPIAKASTNESFVAPSSIPVVKLELEKLTNDQIYGGKKTF